MALASTDTLYVIHRGSGELYHTPPANSVGTTALQSNLRSGNVDQFVGSDGASSNTVFTLTETVLNAQSIAVFINGIYQRPTTNYTVSGTALTFTSSLDNGDEVDVHHHTLRTTVTHVADGSVTSAKLDTNITIAGNLTVTGNWQVDGTTVTLNTQTVEVEDNILQLNTTQASPDTATATTSGITVYRGNGVTQASLIFDDADDTWDLTNNLVVAGNIETTTTTKVKQKGAFMQSSTHQALTLGG